FGFMPFSPGPGLGGHCIPIDPFYLTWKAREFGFYTEFIELAGKVNEEMPYFCRSLVSQALNHSKEMAMKGAKILVLGVAYKPDIADLRESPAVKLISLLGNAGAEVSYHDPHVPSFDELADLSWYCDSDEARRAEFGARYPKARVTASFEEMLADDDLGAVVIATPVPTHHPLTKQALEAGKHVFVEKPPAMRAAEMEELVGLAEERG